MEVNFNQLANRILLEGKRAKIFEENINRDILFLLFPLKWLLGGGVSLLHLSVSLYTQKSRNLFLSLLIRKNHHSLCRKSLGGGSGEDPLFDLTLRSQLISELDRKRARLRATKSVLLCAEGDKNTRFDGGGGGWTKYWIGWKFIVCGVIGTGSGLVWLTYSYFIFDTKFEIF